MRKQIVFSLIFIAMAAVSYSSPPVGIAKDVGYHTCKQDMAIPVAITLTATDLLQELTGNYQVPEGVTSTEIPFMSAEMAKAQHTCTAVGRTIRMRYGATSFNCKIKSKVAYNRILHIDPGLRGC